MSGGRAAYNDGSPVADPSCAKGQCCHTGRRPMKSLPPSWVEPSHLRCFLPAVYERSTHLMTQTLGEPIMLDAATSTIGVCLGNDWADRAVVRQEVGPWLHNHHGRTTLASVGVLADLVLSVGSPRSDRAAVLASITVAMVHELPTTGILTGFNEHNDHDESTATSLLGGQLVDEHGSPLVRIRGLAAIVDRPRTAAAMAVADAIDLRTSRPSSTDLGTYADHIGLLHDVADAQSSRSVWSPSAWTANSVGGVQGGIVLGAMSTATEFAAGLLAEPGQLPHLAEISVDYFRPPAPEAGELTLRTTTVRKSRRFANIDAILTDASSKVMAQSRATILFPML